MFLINTTTRRRIAFVFLTLCAALSGLIVAQRVILAQDRVAFTAMIRESAFDKSGKLVLQQIVSYGVREDGSRVSVRTLEQPGGSGTATQRRIFDLAAAEEVSIDGLTDSVTTIPLLQQSVAAYRRKADCSSEGTELHSRLLGYDVIRYVNDVKRAGGRIFREEEWRAPALDCFTLKKNLYLGQSEADLQVVKINEVIQVVKEAPAQALFERPQGYFERSPLQRRAEFQKRYPGVDCPTCVVQSETDLDAMYYRRQNDRGR